MFVFMIVGLAILQPLIALSGKDSGFIGIMKRTETSGSLVVQHYNSLFPWFR